MDGDSSRAALRILLLAASVVALASWPAARMPGAAPPPVQSMP